MELLLDDNPDSQKGEAFKLNNILETHKNIYQLVCYNTKIKDQNKFVASLYHKDELMLRFEYIIIGSYHKSKNVWIWSDQSLTLNKTIIEQVKDIRLKFYDINGTSEEIKIFCKNNYSVIPSISFCKIIAMIALDIFNTNSQRIITLTRSDEMIDVYIVKRIMFEKIL